MDAYALHLTMAALMGASFVVVGASSVSDYSPIATVPNPRFGASCHCLQRFSHSVASGLTEWCATIHPLIILVAAPPEHNGRARPAPWLLPSNEKPFSAPLLLLLASLLLCREMIISVAAPPPSSLPFTTRHLRPGGVSPLSSLRVLDWKRSKNGNLGGRRGRGTCRAELAQDAPFAVAIGACVLNSLVFPAPFGGPDDDDERSGGAIDSTDARFAVMGIISFIPYFNWMSWVFAWLDSGRQRYLVYSIVYLAPYLRTNLSLSPEESWLPIASILICLVHVQLEASIRNGDLNDIQFLNEVQKLFGVMIRKKESQLQGHQGFTKKGRSKEHVELPSAQESRDKEWRIPREPVDDLHHLNEKPDGTAKEKESD